MSRLSCAQKEEVTRQVTKLLQQGLIRPSASPWSARLVLVAKKDGTVRMCNDFRDLNAVTVRDGYPLPRVDDMLHGMGGAQWFTRFDLQQGYHQIRMKEGAVEKTAFSVPHLIQGSAHFEWVVMPFGLVNAPPIFQRIMDFCFQDLASKVRVYMDDVLVPSATQLEHVDTVRGVLEVFRKHGLRVKRSKCVFAAQQVTFLGHILGRGGLQVEPDKVDAVRRWKTPLTTVKQVRQFVGLASYYRSFVPHFAALAAPLTAMTKKNALVVWTPEAEQAVGQIVQKLVEAPVLQVRRPEWAARVITDASAVGMGDVFEQRDPATEQWHPCAFWSRQFNGAQQQYAPTNREWLAAVEAVSRVWRHWLQGRPFELLTDHAPLKGMIGKASNERTSLQQRWFLALAPFDITVKVIRGKHNLVADALSRTPAFERVSAATELRMAEPQLSAKLLQAAAKTDRQYREVVKEAESSGAAERHGMQWTMGDRLLVSPTGVVWVPESPLVRILLLAEEYETAFAGHRGRQETARRVGERWWWPGMGKDVEEFVRECDRCQRNKGKGKSSRKVPRQFVEATRPGQVVSLDFLCGLAKAQGTGHQACLVMSDRFTKMVWLAGCPDHATAA